MYASRKFSTFSKQKKKEMVPELAGMCSCNEKESTKLYLVMLYIILYVLAGLFNVKF